MAVTFFNLNVHSHKSQLILTAAATSLATAGIVSACYTLSYYYRRRQLGREVLRSVAEQEKRHGRPAPKGKAKERAADVDDQFSDFETYSEVLIKEQLSRNYAIFGDDGMDRVRRGSVVVVGCGGVGSWAAVMLVRSGISKIRLVDFDYVTLSSLNRHATAVLSDVGTPKVTCIERTLKQVSRWVEVDARVDIWRKEEGGKLLEGVDWVIDAIDNISTKVDLIKYCHENGLKVFSSMGAGAKFDPTRIQISDISCTIYDPLARVVRQRLRRMGVSSGIPVVYSTEPPESKLLPLPEEEFQKGNVKDLAVFNDFRIRILPVLGPLPSIFGLHIATYILCELAGKPIANPLPIKNRRKVYEKMLRELLAREEKLSGGTMNKLPIDEDDVSFIYEDLHRGRSLIPPHDIPYKPNLTRWNPAEPLTVENCVVFDSGELKKHLEGCMEGKSPADVWGGEVANVVARRRDEVKVWRDMNM